MKLHFDDGWKDWIDINLKKGCHIDNIYDILIKHDFHPDLVKNTLKYNPQLSIKNYFNESWSNWINISLAQGIQYDDIYNILVKNNFSPELVKNRLNYDIITEKSKILITNEIYFPNAIKINTFNAQIYILDNFLLDHECDELQNITKINKRICDYMGIDVESPSSIQCQQYIIDDEYIELNNNKLWTLAIFLNDINTIDFLNLGYNIIPKKGTGIIWKRHTDNDTCINNKITEKINMITKTFNDIDKHYLHKFIPNYTKCGFEKKKVPDKLFQQIIYFYNKNKLTECLETTAAIGTFIKGNNPATMIELDENIKKIITEEIIGLLNEWSGIKLIPNYVYGIRNYKHGANLKMHVDRYNTHVIGVIINIDQNVDTEWPLYIYDHYSKLHKIFLEPGDMIFYESAKLAHGRPEPLNGTSYANIFMHVMPIDWNNNVNNLNILLERGIATQQTEFPLE